MVLLGSKNNGLLEGFETVKIYVRDKKLDM
jgi:hypothetical protein